MSATLPGKSASRRIRRVAARICAVVAVVAAALALALCVAWLARFRLAAATAKAILPHGDGFENAFTIRKLDLHGAEISAARFGGFPFAPAFSSLRIKWSPAGLRAKRIDAVTLYGFDIRAAHAVPGFAFPSLGKAGMPPLARDILQGWTISSITARTELLDLSPLVPTNAPISKALATMRLSLDAGFADGLFSGRLEGSLAGTPLGGTLSYSPQRAEGSLSLGWTLPAYLPENAQKLETATATLDFAFAEAHGVECHATGTLRFEPCPWRVPFSIDLTPSPTLRLSAKLADLHLSQDDPLIHDALALAGTMGLLDAIQDPAFEGDFSADVEVTGAGGTPTWKADIGLSNAAASAKAGAFPLSVSGGRVRGSAQGCGATVAVSPCFVSFEEASAGLISFGKARATLLAAGKSLVVSEASVGFCGGFLRLYALYLNMERLSTGFTVMLDNLLLSEFITLFPQLAGSEATGRLYGRMPLRIAGDGQVRLGEAFVYTPPGETGNVRIANPEFLTGLLAQAGLPPAVCDSFANALKNLDYEVFRLDLVNPGGEDGRIAIRLQGKAPQGPVITPVNLNANINGPIQKFLNLAIKTAKLSNQTKSLKEGARK